MTTFRRATILRPLTARRIVDTADESRCDNQWLARRSMGLAKRRTVLIVGTVEGHRVSHGFGD
jgi:hypothetical protein